MYTHLLPVHTNKIQPYNSNIGTVISAYTLPLPNTRTITLTHTFMTTTTKQTLSCTLPVACHIGEQTNTFHHHYQHHTHRNTYRHSTTTSSLPPLTPSPADPDADTPSSIRTHTRAHTYHYLSPSPLPHKHPSHSLQAGPHRRVYKAALINRARHRQTRA